MQNKIEDAALIDARFAKSWKGSGRSHDQAGQGVEHGAFHAAALAPSTSCASVRLANGVRLHYAQQGPRTGPALVFLHGYSDSSFSFSRVMPLLPPELRVIAPDLRGHGDSDRPATGYRIADFADDVIEMMDALDVPEAVIVGHSMGSFVAQAIVERAPTRVTRLVLVGSACRARRSRHGSFGRKWMRFRILWTRRSCARFNTAPSRSRCRKRSWRGDCQQQAHAGPRLEESAPGPDGLSSRRCPADVRTLVLGGDCDAVFSVSEQAGLARLNSVTSTCASFDGVGHALHWEQPRRFVEELLRFSV